jgi:hypothetical protein
MLKSLDNTETIRRCITLIAAVLQMYTLSSVLTLTCVNDLTGANVLKGERILLNAFKDTYFTLIFAVFPYHFQRTLLATLTSSLTLPFNFTIAAL